MKFIVIAVIRFYQKFISPYKGFRCAHAALHKGDSCSAAVIKIIEVNGVIRSFSLIKRRFENCTKAYLELSEKEKKEKKRWYDCCDLASCSSDNSCELPSLPCDCSFS